MPDRVEPEGFRPHDPGMGARIAVLEHIAQTMAPSVERIERRLDTLASDQRADMRDIRADFRRLLGIMLAGFASLLGVMAHGFHWL